MKYSEEQIEALLDKVDAFMKSYEEADNEYQTNQRRENWKTKYGERFKPYEDKIKKLNGDSFDLMEESRNEYESQYSDLTDDEYCDALENNIKATLQRIWPDAEPEQIEQATEEVKDAVEEPTATEEKAPEDTETTTTTEETVDDEGNKEVEVNKETKPEDDKEDEEDDEDDDDEDPLDSFTKELEETKKSLPKRK